MAIRLILLIVSVTIIGGLWPLISLLTSPESYAHDEPATSYGCSSSLPIKWSTSTVSYWRDSAWDSSYKIAISNAVNSFNNSDFTWSFQLNEELADVTWDNLNDPDFVIAGYSQMFLNCSTRTFTWGVLYFNFPHFNWSSHTQDQKQCVAIHEMGHGVGLSHNTLTSIMEADHLSNCHDSLIKALQSHDTSDLNTKY